MHLSLKRKLQNFHPFKKLHWFEKNKTGSRNKIPVAKKYILVPKQLNLFQKFKPVEKNILVRKR